MFTALRRSECYALPRSSFGSLHDVLQPLGLSSHGDRRCGVVHSISYQDFPTAVKQITGALAASFLFAVMLRFAHPASHCQVVLEYTLSLMALAKTRSSSHSLA